PSLFDDVAAAERELLEAIEREVGAAALDARAPIPKHACLTLAILGGDVVALHAARERVTTWSAGRVVDWLEDLDTFSFQVARRLHGAEDHDNADALLVRMAGRLFAGAPDAWIEDTLHVVLPPMLGSLPVGALPYRDRPLMDQTTLAYAPRVGSRRARWSRDDAPLIVGSASDALPEVRREVRALKRRFPRGDLLSGGAADPDAVLRAMSGRGLVHLAGHARARDDAPSLSALRVGAGWLAAADLDGVPLTRSLVVLSACRTGDPGLRWHGEALAGFPRALLAAGASRVVASRWEVADAVARRFMDWFYKALETETPAGAVRAACLKVRSRFAHPADWAAFLCVEPGLL
ncbi:MAG: CHAT domain-containing protein, partial [Planctomycetota bacterium]|nr:CHAT domain-containing protein [Planctomycetota bacterium]